MTDECSRTVEVYSIPSAAPLLWRKNTAAIIVLEAWV